MVRQRSIASQNIGIFMLCLRLLMMLSGDLTLEARKSSSVISYFHLTHGVEDVQVVTTLIDVIGVMY